MQSGAPTFGTPEPALVLYALAACARRLGVPFRCGGSLSASKIADAQAAYESANTLQPTILGGVNFVLHAAGWLEGGLAMGYEKFVLDLDQCGMMHEFAKGVDLSPNGQAIDAILENGPGQHFLGTAHTLANFETAFYRSTIADNNSFEQWELEGSLDAAQRANAIWKKMLAEYEAAADRRGEGRGAPRLDRRARRPVVPGLERVRSRRSERGRNGRSNEDLTRPSVGPRRCARCAGLVAEVRADPAANASGQVRGAARRAPP